MLGARCRFLCCVLLWAVEGSVLFVALPSGLWEVLRCCVWIGSHCGSFCVLALMCLLYFSYLLCMFLSLLLCFVRFLETLSRLSLFFDLVSFLIESIILECFLVVFYEVVVSL